MIWEAWGHAARGLVKFTFGSEKRAKLFAKITHLKDWILKNNWHYPHIFPETSFSYTNCFFFCFFLLCFYTFVIYIYLSSHHFSATRSHKAKWKKRYGCVVLAFISNFQLFHGGFSFLHFRIVDGPFQKIRHPPTAHSDLQETLNSGICRPLTTPIVYPRAFRLSSLPLRGTLCDLSTKIWKISFGDNFTFHKVAKCLLASNNDANTRRAVNLRVTHIEFYPPSYLTAIFNW